jgi:hypothetical protein
MEALKQLISTGNLWLAASSAHPFKKTSPKSSRWSDGSGGSEIASKKSRLLSNLRSQQSSPLTEQVVPFGVQAIDGAFAEGGLACGSLHEWFSAIQTPYHQKSSKNTLVTHPPFTLLSHFARQALKHLGEDRFIVWVGKDCWPTAFILQMCSHEESSLLLKQSLFFRTKSNLEKIWAVELALRSRASAAVICQTYDIPFVLTKKLAMAAKQGGGLGLFVRSASELQQGNTPASAASTKWLITPQLSQNAPAWSLKLLKKKGVQAGTQRWLLNSNLKNHTELSFHTQSSEQAVEERQRMLA